MPEQDEAIELDLQIVTRVVEDGDGLALLLEDEFGGRVRIAIKRDPASWFAVRKLALGIEQAAVEVRRLSVGYRETPLTGPTPWPRS